MRREEIFLASYCVLSVVALWSCEIQILTGASAPHNRGPPTAVENLSKSDNSFFYALLSRGTYEAEAFGS